MRGAKYILPAFMILALFGGLPSRLPGAAVEAANSYELIQKARELEKAGDASAAADIYRLLVKRDPSQRSYYAGFLVRQGQTEQALEQFRIRYAEEPRDTDSLRQISELLATGGDFQAAIEYAEKYLLSVRNLPAGCAGDLRKLWDKAGKGEAEAYEHYAAMARAADASSRAAVLAHLVLADFASSRGDLTAAREQYWAALNGATPPADDWQRSVHDFVLRNVFLQRQWLNDALAAYEKHPNYDLLLSLGRQLKHDGRGFEMLALYRDYLLSEPDENIGMWWIGSRATHLKRVGEILSEITCVGEGPAFVERLRAAVVEHPENAEPLSHAGHLLFKMGHYEEGLREFERYLTIKRKPLATDYAWIAGLCEDAELIEDAIRYYENAVHMEWTREDYRRYGRGQAAAQRPGRARVLWPLANLYLQQERWAGAEACLKEILDSDGRWYKEQAKARLTELWERTGRQSVFLDDLEQRVAADPCNVPLRAARAELSLNAGRTQEAVAQFERAVELSPGDLSLRLRLARALAANRQADRALAEYKAVLYAACRKNKDEFRQGKAGDETEPESVLFEAARFCKRLKDSDALLDLYKAVLEALKSPQVRWQPRPYVFECIVRDMAEIYDRDGGSDRSVTLWLAYRKQVGRGARRAVADRLAYLGPLRPYLEALWEEIGADPNDFWGRLILGDMLVADRRPGEAMDVYVKLLHDAPPDRDLHRDLGSLFAGKGRDDLVLIACEKELSTLGKETWEYAGKLGQMASLHLKLGDKLEAARLYREAIACAPSAAEFRYGLFAATGGREGNERPALEPVESLKDKRNRAQTLVRQRNSPHEVVELCEQILSRASTDVRSMVCLARAYEQLGKRADAVSWYERAYGLRLWDSSGGFEAALELERIYHEAGDGDKLIRLLTEQGKHDAIREFYRVQGTPEKFEQYLLEQMRHQPHGQLYVCLAAYYLDRGDLDAAARVYEELRAKIIDEQGKVTDRGCAVALARGLERLGRLDEALVIAEAMDYEHDTAANDWLGRLLTRLYIRSGQFDKAFTLCALRLKRHPHEYGAIEMAGQLADLLKDVTDAPGLIDGFLEELRGQIPEHQYERFRGAVVSGMRTHLPLSDAVRSGPDVLTLLKGGRRVAVPQDCRSFAEFLEQLAAQADTAATQSFMFMSARKMDAPQVGMSAGSAFEVLAAALDGMNVSLEIDQHGHWALYEGADESRVMSYAASGGLLCKTDGFNRRTDRSHLWLLGRAFLEPTVWARGASIQSVFEVVEAVDDRGRTVPVPPIETRWSDSGQIESSLSKQEPPATCIVKMTVKTAVACRTALPPENPADALPPSAAPPGSERSSSRDSAAAVEIVPFELTFHDIPIIDRPPRDR